jgi:hypothetical protein
MPIFVRTFSTDVESSVGYHFFPEDCLHLFQVHWGEPSLRVVEKVFGCVELGALSLDRSLAGDGAAAIPDFGISGVQISTPQTICGASGESNDVSTGQIPENGRSRIVYRTF